MIKKVIMICGSATVGKTSIIKHLVPLIKTDNHSVAICKIDCLHSDDLRVFQNLGVPCVLGLSKDMCPDHYLVSNLEEIIDWAGKLGQDYLIIETAGLCNRCSPATKKAISICVVDCSNGLGTLNKLGPMLTIADIILMTKIDTISQAEREIFTHNLNILNKSASVIAIDNLSGYGAEQTYAKISSYPDIDDYSLDTLRHSMPGGVCSYCIGEQRIGKNFQQGIVEKIIL
jgi:Ni2+-binding GTPase involved in maturation of urease and hydrogenase